MSVERIAVTDLAPTLATDFDLIACDGTKLIGRGEPLSVVLLQLMRSVGIGEVFRADTPDEVERVRNEHNVARISVLDAKAGQTVAQAVRTPKGALALAAGARVDARTGRRLASLGIEHMHVNLGEHRCPSTQRFLDGRARVVQHQEVCSGNADTADMPLDIVEFFVMSWIDVTRKLAGIEFHSGPAEVRRGMVYSGDFAWMAAVEGDIHLAQMVTLERACAAGLTASALELPTQHLSDKSIVMLTGEMVDMLLQDADAMCDAATRDATVTRALPMWDTRIELPTVTWSLTMLMRSSIGWARLVFGLATGPTPVAELMGAQRSGDTASREHARLLASDR